MNNKNIEIDYDEEADILEIFIGEPTECYYDEIDDDLFEGYDKKTKETKGYKIFNLTKRGKDWVKKIKIPLPASLQITKPAS